MEKGGVSRQRQGKMTVDELSFFGVCRWKGTAKVASVLCLPGVASDLRDQKVHAKGCVFVLKETLELGNLLTQHVRCVADAADDAETAGIGDGGCEFGAGGYVHAGKHDGVVDFEEVGDCGSVLIW